MSEANRLSLEARQKAVTEAMNASVDRATTQVHDEVAKLIGGDGPEFARRLQPVLDRFARELAASSQKHTQDIVDRAARQLEADDPPSPIARHAKALREQQEQLRSAVEKKTASLALGSTS